MPGLGHLYLLDGRCLGWFLAALALLLAPAGLGLAPNGPVAAAIRLVGWAALALASAEGAKRDATNSRGLCAALPPVAFELAIRRRAVRLGFTIDVPCPVDELWPFVADLPRFACIDPFHERIVCQSPRLERGVDLTLVHCAFGFRCLRFGRLLAWREGRGYSFSDLSARGGDRGFPHVFQVEIEPLGARTSRLAVRVRGKWTSRIVPIWFAKVWLGYVARDHARLIRHALADRPR